MIGAILYRQIWNKLNLTRKLQDFQQAGKTRHDLAEAIFYMTVARNLMPDSGLAQWNKHNTFLYSGARLQLRHHLGGLLGQFGGAAQLEVLGGGVHQRLIFRHVFQHTAAGHGLDTADAGGHAGFLEDLEETELGGIIHMGAAAQLDGFIIGIDHPDGIAVLFAKEGHSAHLLGFLDGHFGGGDGVRLQDQLVDTGFHLFQQLLHIIELHKV